MVSMNHIYIWLINQSTLNGHQLKQPAYFPPSNIIEAMFQSVLFFQWYIAGIFLVSHMIVPFIYMAAKRISNTFRKRDVKVPTKHNIPSKHQYFLCTSLFWIHIWHSDKHISTFFLIFISSKILILFPHYSPHLLKFMVMITSLFFLP